MKKFLTAILLLCVCIVPKLALSDFSDVCYQYQVADKGRFKGIFSKYFSGQDGSKDSYRYLIKALITSNQSTGSAVLTCDQIAEACSISDLELGKCVGFADELRKRDTIYMEEVMEEGGACPVSDCFDKENTATCKYVKIGKVLSCVADTCKPGYRVFGHLCKRENPVVCDETKGEIGDASGDGCIKCLDDSVAKNGRCEKCPTNKKAAGNKCEDYTCGSREFKYMGKCFACGKYMVPNADSSECVSDVSSDALLSSFRQSCAEFDGVVVNNTKCIIGTSYNDECDVMYKKYDLPVAVGFGNNGYYYCTLR